MVKSLILGLETTSARGSVAVIRGEKTIEEIELGRQLRHSSFIIPAINDLLEQHNLSLAHIDSFAVGVGPGSFTGIRVGIAVTKGLCFNHKSIVTCGIPSMMNIALKCPGHPDHVMVVVYAQRGEFFAQEFQRNSHGFYDSGTECAIKSPASIISSADITGAVVCGPDIKRFINVSGVRKNVFDEPVYPTAQQAALCVSMVTESNDYNSLNPIYIRRSEAETKGPKEYIL
ncbi:MAG: tRNA (adenosine(37)-N6)-threonylcarbamoyltransferase complex dimerization subunit type 1 TsaB [Candidatus Auribacterota bacterium]